MKCNEIHELLDKYADKELDAAAKSIVHKHIANCPACKDKLKTLIEINAVSDMEYLPDPGAAYWRKLTRDISSEIRHTSRVKSQQLKKARWSLASLSPRLRIAAVAFSAVLIFFIIKTSLKELQQSPAGNDTMTSDEQKQLLEASQDAFVKEKLAPRVSKESDPSLQQPPTSSSKGGSTITARGKNEKLPSSAKMTANIPEKSHPPKGALSPQSAEQTGSTAQTYILTFEQVQRTDDLNEKLQIWESFIKNNSDNFSIQRAKFEQAYIYYQIAASLKTETHINTALQFYQTNEHIFKLSNQYSMIESYRTKLQALNK